MKDNQCVQFLQWALPQLNMRWAGFRRVRRQVCRRIDKRMALLHLGNIDAYRQYLSSHPEEWTQLDRMCRITISRFYRDRAVFDSFSNDILPVLLQNLLKTNTSTLRIWSCGCASGEEPYTVALIWHYMYQDVYPDIRLQVTGTDIDPVLIERAHRACYQKSTLRFLPDEWIASAFTLRNDMYCLGDNLKQYVHFELADIRRDLPPGSFQVVFCRNLAFTYFDSKVQERVLAHITQAVEYDGAVIIGAHENIETENQAFTPWIDNLPIYRKKNPE